MAQVDLEEARTDNVLPHPGNEAETGGRCRFTSYLYSPPDVESFQGNLQCDEDRPSGYLTEATSYPILLPEYAEEFQDDSSQPGLDPAKEEDEEEHLHLAKETAHIRDRLMYAWSDRGMPICQASLDDDEDSELTFQDDSRQPDLDPAEEEDEQALRPKN